MWFSGSGFQFLSIQKVVILMEGENSLSHWKVTLAPLTVPWSSVPANHAREVLEDHILEVEGVGESS